MAGEVADLLPLRVEDRDLPGPGGRVVILAVSQRGAMPIRRRRDPGTASADRLLPQHPLGLAIHTDRAVIVRRQKDAVHLVQRQIAQPLGDADHREDLLAVRRQADHDARPFAQLPDLAGDERPAGHVGCHDDRPVGLDRHALDPSSRRPTYVTVWHSTAGSAAAPIRRAHPTAPTDSAAGRRKADLNSQTSS